MSSLLIGTLDCPELFVTMICYGTAQMCAQVAELPGFHRISFFDCEEEPYCNSTELKAVKVPNDTSLTIFIMDTQVQDI